MNFKNLLVKINVRKTIILAVLLCVAILSLTIVSNIATKPETYAKTIESIDEKKATVMGLTTATAITSTALAMVPGDVTTPIANQILEMSTYLLMIVCVLVLEKSLLTVMGYVAFKILIPISCLLLGIFVFYKKELLKTIAVKLSIFALVIVMIVPLSMKIGDLIYSMNIATVEQVTTSVEEDLDSLDEEKEDQSWLDTILSKIKAGAEDVGEKAQKILNNFIDAIAVFIITYCVIPISVVFIMI